MALYKYAQFMEQTADNAFDKVFEPSIATPYSGVYRCEGCGREVASVFPHALPPQNHHQHTAAQGRIRWRLVVGHR